MIIRTGTSDSATRSCKRASRKTRAVRLCASNFSLFHQFLNLKLVVYGESTAAVEKKLLSLWACCFFCCFFCFFFFFFFLPDIFFIADERKESIKAASYGQTPDLKESLQICVGPEKNPSPEMKPPRWHEKPAGSLLGFFFFCSFFFWPFLLLFLFCFFGSVFFLLFFFFCSRFFFWAVFLFGYFLLSYVLFHFC